MFLQEYVIEKKAKGYFIVFSRVNAMANGVWCCGLQPCWGYFGLVTRGCNSFVPQPKPFNRVEIYLKVANQNKCSGLHSDLVADA